MEASVEEMVAGAVALVEGMVAEAVALVEGMVVGAAASVVVEAVILSVACRPVATLVPRGRSVPGFRACVHGSVECLRGDLFDARGVDLISDINDCYVSDGARVMTDTRDQEA